MGRGRTSYRQMMSWGAVFLSASGDRLCAPLQGSDRRKSSWKKRMLPSARSSPPSPAACAPKRCSSHSFASALVSGGFHRKTSGCSFQRGA